MLRIGEIAMSEPFEVDENGWYQDDDGVWHKKFDTGNEYDHQVESIKIDDEMSEGCYICPQCECSSMEKIDERDDSGNGFFRYTCYGCNYSEWE
jgi:hypothetical protein